MISLQLEDDRIEYVTSLDFGWFVRCYGNGCFIKPDGAIRNFGDKMFVGTSEENKITYRIDGEVIGSITHEEHGDVNYSCASIREDLISEHLGIKKDEIGIIFKNNNSKETKLLGIPKGGFCKTREVNLSISVDELTFLLYQYRDGKGQVLILDNPVYQ